MANGRRLREAHAMPCNEVLGFFGVDLDQGLSHRKVETYTMKQFYRPPLRWWPAGAAAPARRWWPAGACPWSAIRCPRPPRRRRRAGQHRRRAASRYRRATIDYHIVPRGDQLDDLSGDHQLHASDHSDGVKHIVYGGDHQHFVVPDTDYHIVPHGDQLDNLSGDHQHLVVPGLDNHIVPDGAPFLHEHIRDGGHPFDKHTRVGDHLHDEHIKDGDHHLDKHSVPDGDHQHLVVPDLDNHILEKHTRVGDQLLDEHNKDGDHHLDEHIVPGGDHQHLVVPDLNNHILEKHTRVGDQLLDEHNKDGDHHLDEHIVPGGDQEHPVSVLDDHIVRHGDYLDHLSGDHQHLVVPDLDSGDHQHRQHERDQPIVHRDDDMDILEQYRDLLASNIFPDNALRPRVVDATFPTEAAFPSRKPWCCDGDTVPDVGYTDTDEDVPETAGTARGRPPTLTEMLLALSQEPDEPGSGLEQPSLEDVD